MANVSKARTGVLIRKLFEILMAQPEGMRASDAMTALANSVQMTAYEAGEYDSGGRRFDKIVRFATVDCVKAGWFLKEKGIWSITDEGKQAYLAIHDPEQFYRKAVELYWKWRKAQPSEDVGDVDADIESEATKSASITLETAEEAAWGEIEGYLSSMNEYDFQKLIGNLLDAMDYHVAWIAPPGEGWRHRPDRFQRSVGYASSTHQGPGQAQREIIQDRRYRLAQLHGRAGR